MSKRPVLFALKCLFSVGVLYLVLRKVDLGSVGTAFGSVGYFHVALAAAASGVVFFLYAASWGVLIQNYRALPLRQVMSIFWASSFIGLFGLGTVASEAYRAFLFESRLRVLALSLASKLYFLAWQTLVAGGFVLAIGVTMADGVTVVAYGVAASAVLSVLAIRSDDAVRGAVSRLLRPQSVLARGIRLIRLPRSRLVSHCLISAAILVFSMVTRLCLFWAVGLSVPVVDMLFLTVVLNAALALPISIQGIGVREYVHLQYAALAGISLEKVLVVSVCGLVVTTLFKVLGFIPFLSIDHGDRIVGDRMAASTGRLASRTE